MKPTKLPGLEMECGSMSTPANESTTVAELQRLLGACVLLQCDGKRPVSNGWQHIRLDDMTQYYLSKLKGNIGVSLGGASGGLCVIDFDLDDLVEPFLQINPTLAATFRTRGRRGCAFWLRIRGDCPRSRKLKSSSGKAVGEFRANGNQSIVSGIHPDTNMPYQWLVKMPVVEMEADSIRWPEGIVNPFALDEFPRESPRLGDSPKGPHSKGCSPLSMLGLGACAGVGGQSVEISTTAETEIEQAIQLGVQSKAQNNAASFQACLGLIRLRGVADLSDMPPAERLYFAEHWFQRLYSLGRVNPAKSKTHYFNDIMNSIKNANASSPIANPIPQAWMLAQTQPLPPEAAMFDGDETMQRLIALCYQLHVLANGGEWFLARNKVGELMNLGATATRNLSENFHVLVDCGILKIISAHEKGKRMATSYRYLAQSPPAMH